MLACFRSAAVAGVDALAVRVEVDVSFGLPSFTMVGLPDTTVRESRDRVRLAIRHSGLEFPPHRVTVNLAPADVRKAGSSFDLPIALGVLASSGQIPAAPDVLVLGELSLDGRINAIKGALPIAVAARRMGVTALLLPSANAPEAAVVDGLGIAVVDSLAEAVDVLAHPDRARAPDGLRPPPASLDIDLADVRGQALAKRALEIAAAGGHNLLMVGPPGSGKTMLARRLSTILPPMSFDETLEASSIHSIAGTLPSGTGLLSDRPFRAPHHTISTVAMVGGGTEPRPGEVSLAHHGVLFLDEMPEFDRRVLEVLRQPLEDGRIVIARAVRQVAFPAAFVLVGAMNPCPCGYFGSDRQRCRCTPQAVERYRGRLSGPLRDRIDVCVDVGAVSLTDLVDSPPDDPSAEVRRRVVTARHRRDARLAGEGPLPRPRTGTVPASMRLSAAGQEVLARALTRLNLSARAYARSVRVARTIADLAGSDEIERVHAVEALQFRAPEARSEGYGRS